MTDTPTATFELPAGFDRPGPWHVPEAARPLYPTVIVTPTDLDAARSAVLDKVRKDAWISDQHAELRRRTPGITDREVEQWTYPNPDQVTAMEYARRYSTLDADGERLAAHVARRHNAVELAERNAITEQSIESRRCPQCGRVQPHGLREVSPLGKNGPAVRVCPPCGSVLTAVAVELHADTAVEGCDDVTVRDRAAQWIEAHTAPADPDRPTGLAALLARARR